jgi:thiol-disulfide isomerase/thioredoxin
MTTRSPAPAGLHTSSTQLPVEGKLPSLQGATGWLNSPPLTTTDLSGKIILVNFWTYTCVNWLRQLPYLRAWAEKYADHNLTMIGVHTPEFGFEHNRDNVRRAAHDLGIEYPVAIDNDYAVWRAFDNHYWPALYFADTQGRIRHHHFGEGEYRQSEMVIQQLLVEAELTDHDHDPVSVDAQGAAAPADWASLRSAETYTGYERTRNFASPGGIRPGRPHDYTAPAELRLNQWALAGDWTVEVQAVRLGAAGGQITCRFQARDLNLVMGPAAPGTPISFRVLLDGQPPGPDHGTDVDEHGSGTLSEHRLHQLVRQHAPIKERTFELVFPEPGAEAYAFTFG